MSQQVTLLKGKLISGDAIANHNYPAIGGLAISLVLAALIIVVGCRPVEPNQVTVAPSYTAALTATKEPTRPLLPTSVSTKIPSAPSSPTLDPDLLSWSKYENDVYAFSFCYPEQWAVAELPHRLVVAHRGSTIALNIRFKRLDEEVTIVRSGIPAGDLVVRGRVSFIGRELDKNVLVFQGKNKMVLYYDDVAEIRLNDLVFALTVESGRSNYEAIHIPEDIQSQADRIVESFTLDSLEHCEESS